MGKTISEKILSNHSGKDTYAGDIVIADIDFSMGQDGTTPLAIKAFNEMNAKDVFDGEKIALVIDHSAPSPNESISKLHRMMREFAKEKGIKFFYDIGCGVCHQLMMERHVAPGDLIVGADSHTCTYGALGAFATGIGSTDMAAVFASGKLWFKVPETIKFIINGKLSQGVYSKDIILYLIGKVTTDGANYMSVEFSGETISELSVEARMTMCNMTVEMGAKTGLIEPDEKTLEYVKEHSKRKPLVVKNDKDTKFSKILEYDISDLEPQISKPHKVDNVCDISKVLGIRIDEAYLGTCTNGRYEDLKIAAEILKNKKINKDVRFIVAPASRGIYLKALETGIIQTFVKAGAAIVTPGCGPCVGTHDGIPADGENVISTANRNFKGRMGNNKAFIYLASPATVAASAINGEISDPGEYVI